MHKRKVARPANSPRLLHHKGQRCWAISIYLIYVRRSTLQSIGSRWYQAPDRNSEPRDPSSPEPCSSGPVDQEGRYETQASAGQDDLVVANHQARCEKKELEADARECKQQNPGGAGCGHGEDDGQDEEGPDEESEGLVKVRRWQVRRGIRVGGQDAGARDEYHGVGDVEGAKCKEDCVTKLGMWSVMDGQRARAAPKLQNSPCSR